MSIDLATQVSALLGTSLILFIAMKPRKEPLDSFEGTEMLAVQKSQLRPWPTKTHPRSTKHLNFRYPARVLMRWRWLSFGLRSRSTTPRVRKSTRHHFVEGTIDYPSRAYCWFSFPFGAGTTASTASLLERVGRGDLPWYFSFAVSLEIRMRQETTDNRYNNQTNEGGFLLHTINRLSSHSIFCSLHLIKQVDTLLK
jgi:hypothetical protein